MMSDKRTIDVEIDREAIRNIIDELPPLSAWMQKAAAVEKIVKLIKKIIDSLAQSVEPVELAVERKGDYDCICATCGKTFASDNKRAVVCFDCAVLKASIEPVELDQISSKDYGADGVGLTHAEVDALAVDESEASLNTFFKEEDIHCNYLECNAGMGLAGSGRCFNKGNAKPDCPQFVDEEKWIKERESEAQSAKTDGKSAIVEVLARFARYAREHDDQEDYDIALLQRAIDERKASMKPVKTEALEALIEIACCARDGMSPGLKIKIAEIIDASKAELAEIRRRG
jgi:hypothetical protein